MTSADVPLDLRSSIDNRLWLIPTPSFFKHHEPLESGPRVMISLAIATRVESANSLFVASLPPKKTCKTTHTKFPYNKFQNKCFSTKKF